MTFNLQQLQAQLLGSASIDMPAAARQMLLDAEQVISPVEVAQALDRLAVRLTVDLQDQAPMFICLIPHSLVFAGLLLPRLVFPLQISCVQAHEQSSQQVTGRKVVLLSSAGEPTVLAKIRDWAVAQGAANVSTAVIVDHVDQPCADYAALSGCAGELFGCGLSAQGYGANLPGIYRVAPQIKESNI